MGLLLATCSCRKSEPKIQPPKPFAEVKASADKGDAKAQAILGWYYYYGREVQTNRDEALHCWQRASEHGDPEAEFAMGFYFYHGQSGQTNVQEAITWWRKAGESGHLQAQMNLGLLFGNGWGVKLDKRIERD
jgi:uncharacterized protein